MKSFIKNIWYGLPMQLLMLHCKRFQIFLVFWYILFSVISGGFMKSFGAVALFLTPEYFGNVSFLSTAIVGFAVGIFVMSWNITTFILNGHFVSFLITTAQPFLKYCINNALLPLAFIIYFIGRAIVFQHYQEFISYSQALLLVTGFLLGFILCIVASFLYFFGADKTVYLTLKSSIKKANDAYNQQEETETIFEKHYIKVKWFYSAKLQTRIPRNIKHYDETVIKNALSRHHFAAVISIIFAFIFLVIIGYFNDAKFFQIPAAASVLMFFALLISVVGAFSIFFKRWSLLVCLCLYLLINFLYQKEIVDPRNKAYGLNYNDKNFRPNYDEATITNLANKDSIQKDSLNYISILNNWKAKQTDSLPNLFIINCSGGGLRSACFTMNVLQNINKQLGNNLMNKTLFISGASGGMLGAAYFRELSSDKTTQVNDKIYVDKISSDLLNPLFSSFVSRDIIGPVQKFNFNNFEYVKDRGFAFEQQLNENTSNAFDKSIEAYKLQEQKAKIPFIFFNSVITRDARKMIIASNAARFMMKPKQSHLIDAVDYTSYFKNVDGDKLKLSSALRMNATFPYVLPNVILPTHPIIDVMDAGIRDNYGLENTQRFINYFENWLQQNTKKIVIINIRDRPINDWGKNNEDDDYLSFLTKPFASMQHNWFKMQDYFQSNTSSSQLENLNNKVEQITWQYVPINSSATAGLSFHLTASEKKNIEQTVHNSINKTSFKKLGTLLK